MTPLREQLENWINHQSATEMLDLLWPVIEAAELASKNMDESYIVGYEFDGTKFEANTILDTALDELKEKLK